MEEIEKEYYQIGTFLDAPVYYHIIKDIDDVNIVIGPVNENPNAGRSIIIPGFKCEPSSNEIISSLSGELITKRINASRYSVIESNDLPICVKPIGDPEKAYYADNGEPYIPFTSPKKVKFIITGCKEFDEFVINHGEKTTERINNRLKI